MQYEPNLKILILSICTYVKAQILVVLGTFWPHWTKFIKFLVLEAIQVKKLHLTVKIGPVWNSKIFDPSGPPKPKIGPQGPRMPRRALIIIVQSNNDH